MSHSSFPGLENLGEGVNLFDKRCPTRNDIVQAVKRTAELKIPAENVLNEAVKKRQQLSGIKLSGRRAIETDPIEAAKVFIRDCLDRSKGFMIPPTPRGKNTGPSAFASGSVQLLPHVSEKIKCGVEMKFRGDNAEANVFYGIQNLMYQLHGDFVCFAEFEINSKTAKFLQLFPKDLGLSSIPINESSNVDFLLISKTKGVMLIEVKSYPDFNKGWNREMRQGRDDIDSIPSTLTRVENFFRPFLEKLFINSSIPFTKIASFPNCRMERTEEGYVNLDSENLLNMLDWWNIQKSMDSGIDDIFDDVIANLVALRCFFETSKASICSPLDDRKAKTASLDKQLHLSANLRIQHEADISYAANFLKSEKANSLKSKKQEQLLSKKSSEALSKMSSEDITTMVENALIKEAKDKIPKQTTETVLALQFNYLTPEQVALWEGAYRQVVEGPPGSGKSLFIKYKGLELIQKGEKVLIFATHPMTLAYVDFYNQQCGKGMTQKLLRVLKYEEFASHKPENIQGSWNVFLDDFFNSQQRLQPENLYDLLKAFMTKQVDKQFFWIMCDAAQTSAKLEYKDIQKSVLEELIGECEFEHRILRNIMRNASNIAAEFSQEWQPILAHTNDRTCCVGNNVKGKCIKTFSTSCDKPLETTIFEIVKGFTDHEDRYENGELAIIFLGNVISSDKIEKLTSKFECNGVNVLNFSLDLDAILPDWHAEALTIATPDNVFSKEWPCVIVVRWHRTVPVQNKAIVKEWMYMAYSRAMYSILVVNVMLPVQSNMEPL